MSPLPAVPEVRRRLMEAQRQEADALEAVEVADRGRARVQRKLESAEAEVLSARGGRQSSWG